MPIIKKTNIFKNYENATGNGRIEKFTYDFTDILFYNDVIKRIEQLTNIYNKKKPIFLFSAIIKESYKLKPDFNSFVNFKIFI